MILVIGATGTVGRRVVAGLLAAGEKVRAFTRVPTRARFDSAVEVVAGDLGRPATVHDALSGVDGVFVLSTGPDALAHELAVADAVRRRGTPRVVKLSSVAAVPPVADAYGAAHASAERAFAESGAEWTALRAAGFMSNALYWAPSIRSDDIIYQAYAGISRAVIDPADVAAVAVTCLTEGGYDGETPQITGPESLTAFQQAAAISALLGRDLKVVDLGPDQALQGMMSGGMPREFATAMLASLADPDPRRGGTPLVTGREITGRQPATFDAWLRTNLTELGGR